MLLPKKSLNHVKQLLHDLDVVFGGFLIAQLIAAILAGIFSTIILLVIKHPFAILVGLVTGVANVIPYIGPILGAHFRRRTRAIFKLKFSHLIAYFINNLSTIRCQCHST